MSHEYPKPPTVPRSTSPTQTSMDSGRRRQESSISAMSSQSSASSSSVRARAQADFQKIVQSQNLTQGNHSRQDSLRTQYTSDRTRSTPASSRSVSLSADADMKARAQADFQRILLSCGVRGGSSRSQSSEGGEVNGNPMANATSRAEDDRASVKSASLKSAPSAFPMADTSAAPPTSPLETGRLISNPPPSFVRARYQSAPLRSSPAGQSWTSHPDQSPTLGWETSHSHRDGNQPSPPSPSPRTRRHSRHFQQVSPHSPSMHTLQSTPNFPSHRSSPNPASGMSPPAGYSIHEEDTRGTEPLRTEKAVPYTDGPRMRRTSDEQTHQKSAGNRGKAGLGLRMETSAGKSVGDKHEDRCVSTQPKPSIPPSPSSSTTKSTLSTASMLTTERGEMFTMQRSPPYVATRSGAPYRRTSSMPNHSWAYHSHQVSVSSSSSSSFPSTRESLSATTRSGSSTLPGETGDQSTAESSGSSNLRSSSSRKRPGKGKRKAGERRRIKPEVVAISSQPPKIQPRRSSMCWVDSERPTGAGSEPFVTSSTGGTNSHDMPGSYSQDRNLGAGRTRLHDVDVETVHTGERSLLKKAEDKATRATMGEGLRRATVTASDPPSGARGSDQSQQAEAGADSAVPPSHSPRSLSRRSHLPQTSSTPPKPHVPPVRPGSRRTSIMSQGSKNGQQSTSDYGEGEDNWEDAPDFADWEENSKRSSKRSSRRSSRRSSLPIGSFSGKGRMSMEEPRPLGLGLHLQEGMIVGSTEGEGEIREETRRRSLLEGRTAGGLLWVEQKVQGSPIFEVQTPEILPPSSLDSESENSTLNNKEAGSAKSERHTSDTLFDILKTPTIHKSLSSPLASDQLFEDSPSSSSTSLPHFQTEDAPTIAGREGIDAGAQRTMSYADISVPPSPSVASVRRLSSRFSSAPGELSPPDSPGALKKSTHLKIIGGVGNKLKAAKAKAAAWGPSSVPSSPVAISFSHQLSSAFNRDRSMDNLTDAGGASSPYPRSPRSTGFAENRSDVATPPSPHSTKTTTDAEERQSDKGILKLQDLLVRHQAEEKAKWRDITAAHGGSPRSP